MGAESTGERKTFSSQEKVAHESRDGVLVFAP